MRWFILLLPWLELLTLIQLGIKTSALAALAYVFFTMLLGIVILRLQGRELFRRLREAQTDGAMLGPQFLVDDLAMGVAGILLVIPGMITDFIALIVLIGPLRRRLAAWLSGAGPVQAEPFRADAGESHTLEGDFRRIDDD